MAENEEIFGFNRADSDQLIKMIGVAGVVPQYDQRNLYDATRLVFAYTTGGATARSGSTVGTGTAAVKYLDGNSITDAGYNVDFKNVAGDPVGTGKYVLLLRLGGDFVCVWEECT